MPGWGRALFLPLLIVAAGVMPADAQLLDANSLQAEAAALSATPVENAVAGFHGTGYANFPASGGSASWSSIDGGPGGGVNITIRYALGGSTTLEAPLTVNGATQRIKFSPSGATTWGSVTAFARLNAGAANTIQLATDGQDIGIVDEITLSQPAPVKVPTRVYWGGYQGMGQLVGTGASQWTFVQQNQDGVILHGAYWGDTTQSPSPATVGPQLATLLAPYNPHYIYEYGFPGTYPAIDSALGTSAGTDAITKLNTMVGYGFSRPDISTDYHMYAWQESMRYHPEWSEADFFTALCGNWETYTSGALNPGGSDRTTYGWFRQFVEKLAGTFPDVRVTATNSPVYFNWNSELELGDYNNTYYAWLKLERHGTSVEGFWSAEGSNWKSLGTTSVPSGAAFAGLAVTSNNNSRLASAKFTDIDAWDFFLKDIGLRAKPGTLTQSAGVYTMTSYGDNATRQGAKDSHYYAYRDTTGDGTFTVRVDSLTGSNPSRTWPLAGLEIRETLNNDARFVNLYVNAANEVHFQSRATAATTLTNLVTVTGQSAPKWLRLDRTGNVFTASRSDDGTTWVTVGTTTLALNSAVKVGLVADSQVYFETVTAQFSNVSFLTSTIANAAWTSTDIGSPGVAGATTTGTTMTVDASGSDIGATADSFRFVSKPLAGDGTVLARCLYFADKSSPSTALPNLAKMGVMVRSSTAAGSVNACSAFTAGSGIQFNSRTVTGGTTSTTGQWNTGEARIITKQRPVVHYLTGNTFMTSLRDAFPGTYQKNWAGFTTDSPYPYMKWGGTESYPDAITHRQKIRDYEAFLQGAGAEHQLIANDTTGGASGTQAEKDAWDLTYANNSLRSIELHQLEGGRPNRVLFESWYSGPYALVPETKAGSFTNLALTGIKYLKGVGQSLDLSLKRSSDAIFYGDTVQQTVPGSVQWREWRAPTSTSTETFTVRLKNNGEVDALPVLQAYESGGTGWTVTYTLGGTNVSTAIKSADGQTVTDSATAGQELIAPGASVDLTVSVAAATPTAARDVLIRAFWNPQDPNLAVKDAVRLSLLPPNVAPTASGAGATVIPGASIDIDLWTLTSDPELADNALWYSVTGAANGTATLLADGHTVRFTPAAGYNGPASFTYTVRNAVTDSRLLRSYTFEAPDAADDAVASDAAHRGDASLSAVGTGSYAYESGAPPSFGSTQSQCLHLTDGGANNNAKLTTVVASTEWNLGTSSWTASTWFKRASQATPDILFHAGNGNGFSGDGCELHVHGVANSDTIQLLYYDAANVQQATLTSAAGTVPVNSWHHLAVVWTAAGGGNGTFSLYLDGALVGTSGSVVFAPNQAQPLSFGGSPTGDSTDRHLNGWLDDCALYSAALGAGEIANLARMSVASNAGVASSGTVTLNVDDSATGLIARWPFDGNASDVSGNGWTLTLGGSAAPTAAAKIQGTQSLGLSGSGSSAATSAAVPLGGAFTVAAWVYVPSGTSQIQTVAANSAGGGNASGFRFYVNGYNTGDGKLVLETGNGTAGTQLAAPAGTIAFDRWQHVAAVVNRTVGTATLYRNGMSVASGACRTDFANSAVCYLGAMGSATYPLKSNLDDARLYNRTLSAAEITTLVKGANTPPSISTVTNQTLTEGTATGALPFTIGDAETAPQHLVVTVASSNPTLVPVANVALGGSGASRTVTVTPAANTLGTANVTLTVNDGALPAANSFSVTVTSTPAATWRFTNFGTTANANSAADSADPDGDLLTNLQEYVFGTDPKAAGAPPLLTIIPSGSNVTLSFVAKAASGPGYTGLTRLYDVLTTNTLSNSGSWTGVPGSTGIVGANQTVTIVQPAGEPNRVYRLSVGLQ